MAKLKAKQALDSSQLPGVPMLFKPHTAYFYNRDDDSFRVAPNALKEGTILDVYGNGFDYVFSRPTNAGTVTEINVRLDKQAYYNVSGLHVKLKSIFDADLEKATKLFFSGNDKFSGSPGDDIFDSGEGKDKLLGKDGADQLYGKAGNDTLNGGKGIDVLSGGGGRDTYIFKNADATDSIVKLKASETIELARKAFPALTKGQLPEDQFFLFGSGIQDDNDYIVYKKGVGDGSGVIYYDPDGGAGSATQIAITTLQPEFEKLGADNFLVI
jgi:Ca2+-binding RTX toxin-like protein